jgi:hypothetical protein
MNASERPLRKIEEITDANLPVNNDSVGRVGPRVTACAAFDLSAHALY